MPPRSSTSNFCSSENGSLDITLRQSGEVFRTMLPLNAEFKRTIGYRITEQGHNMLFETSTGGSPLRSHKTPEEHMVEIRYWISLPTTKRREE